MEIVALVISICAFLVSIVVPIFEFLWNQKMNRHNLEAEYFKDTYGEILYNNIPKAIQYIHYDGKKVSGTDNIIDVLRDIRVRSVYFKVADETFYKRIKGAVQDLEDFIITTDENMSSAQFASFYGAINEKIEIIYKNMSDKYIGK